MRTMNLPRWTLTVALAALGVGLSIPAPTLASVPGLSYRSSSQTVARNSFSDPQTSSCGPNRSLVSGGAGTFGANKFSGIVASGPASFGLGGEWLGRTENFASRRISSYVSAICARDSFASGTRSASASIADIAPHSQASVVANCPAETTLLGGGGKVSVADNAGNLVGTRPLDGPDADSKPDDAWQITVDNYSATDLASATTSAICAPRSKIHAHLRYFRQDGSKVGDIGPFLQRILRFHCPNDSKPLYGGIGTSAGYGELRLTENLPQDFRSEWVTRLSSSTADRIKLRKFVVCASQ